MELASRQPFFTILLERVTLIYMDMSLENNSARVTEPVKRTGPTANAQSESRLDSLALPTVSLPPESLNGLPSLASACRNALYKYSDIMHRIGRVDREACGSINHLISASIMQLVCTAEALATEVDCELTRACISQCEAIDHALLTCADPHKLSAWVAICMKGSGIETGVSFPALQRFVESGRILECQADLNECREIYSNLKSGFSDLLKSDIGSAKL